MKKERGVKNLRGVEKSVREKNLTAKCNATIQTNCAALCLMVALDLLDQMTLVAKACWQSSADAK